MSQRNNRKIFVLGADGFVGRHVVVGLLRDFAQVMPLNRNEFELGNLSHYSKFQFSESIIVDCISKIDGSPEDIYKNNYESFTIFIDYLLNHHKSFNYVYFSTLSTNDSELISNNAYINSKYKAEQYLITNLKDYKIIKLSFPFGEGESSKRLISRIINKIRDNESLQIRNIELSLMPISCLCEDICQILNFKSQIIQYYNTHVIDLEVVVKFVYEQLNIKCNYELQNNNTRIRPSLNLPKITRCVNPLLEIKKLLQ